MENGKLAALISFVIGAALGANWLKIKKFMPQAKQKVVAFTKSTVESVEDVTKKVLHRTPEVEVVAKAKD